MTDFASSSPHQVVWVGLSPSFRFVKNDEGVFDIDVLWISDVKTFEWDQCSRVCHIGVVWVAHLDSVAKTILEIINAHDVDKEVIIVSVHEPSLSSHEELLLGSFVQRISSDLVMELKSIEYDIASYLHPSRRQAYPSPYYVPKTQSKKTYIRKWYRKV